MISVTNVSKTYLIWNTPLSRVLVPLAHRVLRPVFPGWYERWSESHYDSVTALQDISLELEQGDSLGVIGLNGSGKSTLLQIIAGTLPATTGNIKVEGRVAALLELGSGFNHEFTGKENVYLNASILGLSKRETDARYDDIVEFADIAEFIDRQVKTYSSGMIIRLAFAVQVHVDPDILIVDEALAVGDAQFQAKALTKLDEILEKGTSLLFVGHDLNTVRSFCNRAMLLDNGKLRAQGKPDDVIANYLHFIQQNSLKNFSEKKSSAINKGFSIKKFGVTHASIDGFGKHASVGFDENIDLRLTVSLGHGVRMPCLILDIIDAKGLQLTGKRIPIPPGEGVKELHVNLQCCFQMGVYRFRMRVVDAPTIDQTTLISRQDDLLSLELTDDVRDRFTGLFPVPLSFQWAGDQSSP